MKTKKTIPSSQKKFHGINPSRRVPLGRVYGRMRIRPSSKMSWAIHGCLQPASIVTYWISGNRPVTCSYTPSYATLSWTFPDVTFTPKMIPWRSHTVWLHMQIVFHALPCGTSRILGRQSTRFVHSSLCLDGCRHPLPLPAVFPASPSPHSLLYEYIHY